MEAARTRLIVGLGNPGPEYQQTRHNAGFLAVEEFARQRGWLFRRDRASRSLLVRERSSAGRILLALPQTYMNCSGEAVGFLMNKEEVRLADLLVVYDDVALPLGALRIRSGGSCGGHKGLRSIQERLGTARVARLRVGILGDAVAGDLSDYVLSPFGRGEKKVLADVLVRAAQAITMWTQKPLQECMDVFNRRVNPSAQGKKAD